MSYQENIDLFSWKYKFYDIKDKEVKDCKFFSPYTKTKNKGFEFEDTQETEKYLIDIDNQNKNIICSLNWKRYLFCFDSHYRDQNLMFVFDQNQDIFITNKIFSNSQTL